MNTYKPDGWVLIKVLGDDLHYRVFGCWRGGYLDGDYWRINSGVTSVTEDASYYYFKGSSDSTYTCHKGTYGELSPYCASILYALKDKNSIEVIKEIPDIMNMNWVIQ